MIKTGETPFKVSRVEVAVLGLLAEQPMHGYGLFERFRMGGYPVDVGRASIYQCLRRLEQHGLVGGREQHGGQGPDRRVFKITPAGHKRLLQGMRERFSRSDSAEAGLALALWHLLPGAEGRRALDERERALLGLIERVAVERRSLGSSGAAEPGGILDRSEILAQAELGWLADFKARLP